MRAPNLKSITTYLSRYAYVITLTVICITLTLLVWFLYVRVYQTLTQAELVVQLKGHVSTQTLQVEQHQSVLDKIKAKSQLNVTTISQNTTTTATSTSLQKRNPFEQIK